MTVSFDLGTVGHGAYGEAVMSDARRGRNVWQRSGRCDNDACVEVTQDSDGGVLLRSSRRPASVLRFTTDEWSVFLTGLMHGDFD